MAVMAKNKRIRSVDEDEYGVYVWITPAGQQVEDADRNVMNIPAKAGDRKAMAQLREAAKYYGVPGGYPKFLPGRRQITDAELEDQKARLAAGLIPDPYDHKALQEELRIAQTRND